MRIRTSAEADQDNPDAPTGGKTGLLLLFPFSGLDGVLERASCPAHAAQYILLYCLQL